MNSNNKRKINVKINVLSYASCGRSVLINACKHIANNVKLNKLDVSEINQEFIDNQILGNFKIKIVLAIFFEK